MCDLVTSPIPQSVNSLRSRNLTYAIKSTAPSEVQYIIFHECLMNESL